VVALRVSASLKNDSARDTAEIKQLKKEETAMKYQKNTVNTDRSLPLLFRGETQRHRTVPCLIFVTKFHKEQTIKFIYHL